MLYRFDAVARLSDAQLRGADGQALLDLGDHKYLNQGALWCAMPLIVITTNEERELPAAFVRRCVVLNLNPPEDEAAFIDGLIQRGRAHARLAQVHAEVARQAAAQGWADRQVAAGAGYPKVGLAEFIDLLTALDELTASAPPAQRTRPAHPPASPLVAAPQCLCAGQACQAGPGPRSAVGRPGRRYRRLTARARLQAANRPRRPVARPGRWPPGRPGAGRRLGAVVWLPAPGGAAPGAAHWWAHPVAARCRPPPAPARRAAAPAAVHAPALDAG